MSILINNRDYVPDGAGSVTSVSGSAALLNEILFRLSVRRGSFPLLPDLGSRLHLLRQEKPSQRTALARQYAAEALAELTDVTVTDALVTPEEGRLHIRVELLSEDEALTVELEG